MAGGINICLNRKSCLFASLLALSLLGCPSRTSHSSPVMERVLGHGGGPGRDCRWGGVAGSS